MKPEIKAYVTLILSYIGVGLYFLWALTPERIINSYGITYYPSKHWAVALPASLVLLVFVSAFYSYFSERSMLPPLDSCSSFKDPIIKGADDDKTRKGRPLRDISLELVNQKLYG